MDHLDRARHHLYPDKEPHGHGSMDWSAQRRSVVTILTILLPFIALSIRLELFL